MPSDAGFAATASSSSDIRAAKTSAENRSVYACRARRAYVEYVFGSASRARTPLTSSAAADREGLASGCGGRRAGGPPNGHLLEEGLAGAVVLAAADPTGG
jgi:hypothetical protein